MNSAEVSARRENGRQERKGEVLVMFTKKFWQLPEEKFWPMSESNACGKGLGTSGGVDGTVGRL